MQRATRLLPIALAMAVSLAPAAFAAKTQAGAGKAVTTRQQVSAMQGILPGGISFKGQMDHAYTEALNAQEAVALGMNDMAANHLANVDLIVSHLEDQMAGGGAGKGQEMSAETRSHLSTIRQEASTLQRNLGNRSNAIKGTSQLVSRFVSFYDTMGTTAMGGGGGAAARPVQAPAELVGSAGRLIGEAQAALAGRDFEAASLRARDAVNHLQMAEKMATQHKFASSEITHLKQLHQEASKLHSSIEGRSASATKQAGMLVTRIGSELPHVAEASMGGGAGMQR